MKLQSIVMIATFTILACEIPHNDIPPEVSAAKWVSDMGLRVQGSANCTQIDTDRDGYVTCTVAVTQPDSAPKLLSLQCAVVTSKGCDPINGIYAVGCKETVVKGSLMVTQ